MTINFLEADVPLENIESESAENRKQCACGCGEYLPPGSKRMYKRNHKNREGQADAWDSVSPELEYAADGTPLDPAPSNEPPRRIRVTKRMRDDIAGKLGMVFFAIGTAWSMRDPICGEATLENAENMGAKAVPIILKSPELTRWFLKGGGYMEWFDFLMACLPVAQIVAQHHLFHNIESGPRPNPVVEMDAYRV